MENDPFHDLEVDEFVSETESEHTDEELTM
jgi:hypothetical protein